jgi:hypothetical protein
MATLKHYGWNKRTAFLIALVMVFASTAIGPAGPTRAYASSPCCGFDVVVTYYSDDSHTTQVGHCTNGACTPNTCSGTQTDFYTTRVVCCQSCTA